MQLSLRAAMPSLSLGEGGFHEGGFHAAHPVPTGVAA